MLSLAGSHLVGALNPLSSTSLLASLGALGVVLVLFAETGLLIGFFLPGDSLRPAARCSVRRPGITSVARAGGRC
jgi:membrane protein DedA with SNARE-associated domain